MIVDKLTLLNVFQRITISSLARMNLLQLAYRAIL